MEDLTLYLKYCHQSCESSMLKHCFKLLICPTWIVWTNYYLKFPILMMYKWNHTSWNCIMEMHAVRHPALSLQDSLIPWVMTK